MDITNNELIALGLLFASFIILYAIYSFSKVKTRKQQPQRMVKKFCPYCGNNIIEEDAKHCPNCGAELQ